MALSKEQKKNVIEKIKDNLEKQKILLFVGISGLKAGEMLDLRTELKENNCLMSVVKKTLLRIASVQSKAPIDIKNLESEIALVYGFKDEVSSARIVNNFSQKNENLKILGGVFENQFIDTEKVVELAKIPSREQLLARLVGSIKAPASGFASVLEGNIRSLVYVLRQIKS